MTQFGQVADAVPGNWVDRLAPEWTRPFLRLSRADRPVGTWLLLIPVFVLQSIFNWGLGMLLAPAVHRIPDVSNILSFFMRLWMYSSGIFYDPSRFVDDERILALFHFNPLYQVLYISRDLVLRAQVPSWSSWAVLVTASLGILIIGFLVFWRNEESYADER